jgi:hypothetical protein
LDRLVQVPFQRSTWGMLTSLAIAGVLLGVAFAAARGYEQISAAPLSVAETAQVARPMAVPTAGAIAPTQPPLAVALIVVPTPEPTLVRAAVPAVPSDPLPAGEFRLLLDERFGTNVRGWPDDFQGTAWLADGSYHLVPRDPGRFVAVGVPGTDDLQDVVVSANFHKLGGPAGGGYGLILRDQSTIARDGRSQVGRFYVFEIGDRGDIGVWLRDQERWIDLMSWKPSDVVHPGKATNQLTVSAIGDRLSFIVNGAAVASQQDTLLQRGSLGVFAGGDGNEVALDRVTVRVSH